MPNNICVHQEEIDPTTHIGVCKLCGQERQYDRYNCKPPVIIKGGRVPDDPPAIKEETIVAEEPTGSVLKPENWPNLKLRQKKYWYDEQKQEILTDLATIGSFETRKRWGVTHSTLNGLLKRWGEPPQPKKARKSKEPAVSKKVQELLPIPMPLFPSFDKGWLPVVQGEWLRAYAEIVKAVYPGNK